MKWPFKRKTRFDELIWLVTKDAKKPVTITLRFETEEKEASG